MASIVNARLTVMLNMFVFVLMLIFAFAELLFSNYVLYFLFLTVSYLNLIMGLSLYLHTDNYALISLKKWVALAWLIILGIAGGVLLSAYTVHSALLMSTVPYIVLYDGMFFGLPALIMYCLDSMR